MPTASAWQVYNAALMDLGLERSAALWNVALFGASSNASDLTRTRYAELTDEVPGGTGYLPGGSPLLDARWTREGRRVTFRAEDVAWTASTGPIAARYTVIYRLADGALLCVSELLTEAGGPVVVPDRGTLRITMAEDGLIQLAGSDTR